MPLEAKIEKLSQDAAIVKVSGSMTLGTALKMLDSQVQTLVRGETLALTIDLSGVDFIDSAGLGLLVHTYGLLEAKQGTLRLCGPQPRVSAVLNMTRTNTFLTIDEVCGS